MQISSPCWLETSVAMATVLCPTCRGGGHPNVSAPSMKLIGPAGTELRFILAIYIMCCCDLDLWPNFPKIGPRDPEFLLNVHAYLKNYRRFSFWYIRS